MVDRQVFFFFFFNDTATTEIYTLPLHDALPISRIGRPRKRKADREEKYPPVELPPAPPFEPDLELITTRIGRPMPSRWLEWRSDEHTSELQSRPHLVCRLLLEKKKAHKGNRF